MSLERYTQIVHSLAKLNKVPAPKVVLNCEQTCLHRCWELVGCYRHYDNAICMKTGKDSVQILLHEFGHFLNHAINGFHPFSPTPCEPCQCEAFAKHIENLYLPVYGNMWRFKI